MRENSDPDILLVSEFKGMATSGGGYGASLNYLDNITNASVEKDGRIIKRPGSRAIYSLPTPNNNETNQIFQFSFFGQTWIAQRVGKTLQIYIVKEDINGFRSVIVLANKANVLINAFEEVSFAVKAEGDYCHVFVASASTQLISLTISAREVFARNVLATNARADVGGFYTTANNTNTKILIGKDELTTTSLSIGATGELSFNYTTKPNALVNGTRLFLFSCFWLRYCDSNYYIGTQLYNKSLRLNTIPLDVNVEIPETVRTNYILNEPIQDLTAETVYIYRDTNIGAGRLTWSGNRNPASSTTWDFSNGSYTDTAGKLTTRTPVFAAFGALENNNVSEQLNIARLRSFLIGSFEKPRAGNIRVYEDKVQRTTIFHRQNTTPITNYTTEEPTYFSMASFATQSPGCSLDAVIEVCYTLAKTGGAASSLEVADISRDLKQIKIGDGFIVPLYGYSILAKQKSGVFPNKVYVVGNRLILSGGSNRVLISANDWNYRGFTLTNLQISSFNFSENSPYLLQVEQGGGNVNSIRSVNGVLIVSTDNNTYRVTSNDRNSPPNATAAVVSRLTNQIATERAMEVVNNSVYMANENGLFSLEYKSENDEGVVEELSLEVSDIFRLNKVETVNYSRVLDSILVSLSRTNKLLRYSLRSRTWSYIHVSIPFKLELFSTFDGFTFTISSSNNSNKNFVVCSWNADETEDLTNIEFLTQATIGGNALTIANEAVEVESFFATLPAMFTSINPNFQQVYNKRIKSRNGSPTVFVETNAGNASKEVIAGFSTKGHHNNRTGSSLRFRNVNLIISGYGTANLTVTPLDSNENIQPTFSTVTINTNGTIDINNKQNTPAPKGTEAVVRISDLGISESFSLAVTFDSDISIIGYQLDSGAKANRRLK